MNFAIASGSVLDEAICNSWNPSGVETANIGALIIAMRHS